jgi:hypothetical protein
MYEIGPSIAASVHLLPISGSFMYVPSTSTRAARF